MEVFFIRALQLIMALSLLVLVHEFGHFIFSRIFKVRVEKFYHSSNGNPRTVKPNMVWAGYLWADIARFRV